jgi:hypothetical protein
MAKAAFQRFHKFGNRFICLPRQQKASKICGKVVPLGSFRGGCIAMSIGQHGGTLCKPPLVNHSAISPTIENVSPDQSFDGHPLLGFSHMVAPINKDESARDPLPENHPLQGYVHQLQGGTNATPQVAPTLHDLLRQILEGKQIQVKTIEDFLGRNPSLKRYQSAFALLWVILEHMGVPPPEATTDQVADALIQLFQFSRHKPVMHTVLCF